MINNLLNEQIEKQKDIIFLEKLTINKLFSIKEQEIIKLKLFLEEDNFENKNFSIISNYPIFREMVIFNFNLKTDNINNIYYQYFYNVLKKDNIIINLLDNNVTTDTTELFEKIIWQKIKEKIRHNIGLNSIAENLKNSNIYINEIINIANKNKLNISNIVNLLFEENQLLLNINGGKTLFDNINIFQNILLKYEKIENANKYLLNYYIDLSHIFLNYFYNNNNLFKNKILSETIININNKNYNLQNLKELIN